MVIEVVVAPLLKEQELHCHQARYILCCDTTNKSNYQRVQGHMYDNVHSDDEAMTHVLRYLITCQMCVSLV